MAQKRNKQKYILIRRAKMRKLLAGMVVLVMFGMCASSYGYFLIYKVSTSVKGVDDETATTVPMKGYFILNFDDFGGFQDANLVMYGKNPDKEKVYVVLNYTGNEYLDVGVWEKGDYCFLELGGNYSFAFGGLLSGKMKAKDIGLDDDVDVANSMKGVFWVEEGMLLDSSQDISGTANISATLWMLATKGSNEDPVTWTQDTILEEIESGYLAGYTDATP